MGKTQQELAELLKGNSYQVKMFGKKSRFYRQIMEDGNVFNPYIHRRFLPAHYLQLANAKNYDPEGMVYYLRRHMGRSYFDRVLKKELSTLSYLSKVDLWAYEERCLMYSVDQYKEFFIKAIHYTYYSDLYVEEYSKKISAMTGYQELYEFYNHVLSGRSWFLDNGTIIIPYLKEFYLKAGAYYTLKHEIMFCNNKCVPGEDSVEQCEYILQKLKEGKDWEFFHSLLKRN